MSDQCMEVAAARHRLAVRSPAAFILTLLLALVLSACATRPHADYERTPTFSLAGHKKTDLGRFFQEELDAHPGESGVALIRSSEWAFRVRAALADMAQKTLDLQYYIWDLDRAGSVLAERVLRAADRGVRVRILIDDINTGESEFEFAALDLHPNIEIRLFNPFGRRGLRGLDFVLDLDRVNHRMHNKAFIADNSLAIIGGRNIGDDYFGVDTVANFRDLDMTVVGPVVQDVSRSFDVYWNSEQAIPVSAIIDVESPGDETQSGRERFYDWVSNIDDFPYDIHHSREELFEQFEQFRPNFVWARAYALYDAPHKLKMDKNSLVDNKNRVAANLRQAAGGRRDELMLEAAYLIPGERGVEATRRQYMRGVRVRILTNSLATNDVAAAHAGYAKYRKDLLRAGAELYELRPDASLARRDWLMLAGKSRASLHTKAFVSDRNLVAVGSFNLDPRSEYLNTEIVVLVESPELAEQVRAYMQVGMAPENSYRVTLEPNEKGTQRLVWTTVDENGETVRYYTDPEAGTWQRFSAWLMSLLPIEEHL